METECRIPSRRRTCWSLIFESYAVCMNGKTRDKLVCCQSWFAFIVKSSLATLHQEHSIESRWHLKNPPIPAFVGNLKRWQVHNLNEPCRLCSKLTEHVVILHVSFSRSLEAMAVYSGRGWPWEIVERSYNLHRRHHPELTTGSWCSSLLASRTTDKLSN